MEEVREEEKEGSRSQPEESETFSFVLSLVRDPDTWGQHGLDGFTLKKRDCLGRTHADADESAR